MISLICLGCEEGAQGLTQLRGTASVAVSLIPAKPTLQGSRQTGQVYEQDGGPATVRQGVVGRTIVSSCPPSCAMQRVGDERMSARCLWPAATSLAWRQGRSRTGAAAGGGKRAL